MFPWSTVNVMNAYVDNVLIYEYEKNSPKENVPPSISIPDPKIYPIVVPKIISYTSISHFIVLFVDIVHA